MILWLGFGSLASEELTPWSARGHLRAQTQSPASWGGHELSGCLGLEVSARRVSEMGSVVLRLNREDGRGRGAQPRLRSVRTEAGLLLSSPAGNNTSAPCRVIAGHPQFLRLLKPEVKGHPHSLLMSSPARRAAALKKGRARCHPWLGTK